MRTETISMTDIIRNAVKICGSAEEIATDYHTGYICDTFAEYADSHTSIYYYDIIRYISEHVEEVNNAIEKLGWDGCGGDLYKAGQAAEYMQIERDLYEHTAEIIEAYAADYIRNTHGDSIPAEIWEEIADRLNGLDDSNDWDDVRGAVDDVIAEFGGLRSAGVA